MGNRSAPRHADAVDGLRPTGTPSPAARVLTRLAERKARRGGIRDASARPWVKSEGQRLPDASGNRSAPLAQCGKLAESVAERASQLGERAWMFRAELLEQPVVCGELASPGIAIEVHDLIEERHAEIEPGPFEIVVFGLQAEGCFDRVRTTTATLDDP